MGKKLKIVTAFVLTLWTLIAVPADAEDGVKSIIVGKGTPVVFVPGLGCPGEVFQEVVEAMKTGHECHVLTLPGFAGQPTTAEPSVEGWCQNVTDYIQRRDLKSPVLVGHSLGGFLTLRIATQNPELVGKLVVVDSLPYPGAALNPAATPALLKPQAEALRNALLEMDDATRQGQERAKLGLAVSDPDDLEKVLSWTMESDPRALAQGMYGMLTMDLRPDVENMSCPTMVLGTWIGLMSFASEEQIKASIEEQYKDAKNVRVIFSDTSKHFVMLDDPAWLVAQIKTFLSP